jgi:H+/Cl- antiporter ClcA
MAVLGNYTYFGISNASIDNYAWPAVVVCGLTGGLMGGLFSRFIVAVLSYNLPWGIGTQIKRHPYFFAGLCRFGVAIIGVCSHDTVYGSGYRAARHLIEGSASVPWSFGLLKMGVTALSSISGIAGGIFAPSLATGAGLGANIAHFFPSLPTTVLVILGMVAYFSGIVQAPITAFVIVFEMTNNHAMIVPIMAAALIGSVTSKLVCPNPVYHALAENTLRQMNQPQKLG